MASPKKLDPEIAALRDEHKGRVADLRVKKRSAAVLKTILEKRLPTMTMGDRQKLMDELALNVTPSIPILLEKPTVLPSQLPKPVEKLPPTPKPAVPRTPGVTIGTVAVAGPAPVPAAAQRVPVVAGNIPPA